MQRRKGEQVLSAQVNVQALQAHAFAQRLLEAIIHLNVFQSYESRILQKTRIRNLHSLRPVPVTVGLVSRYPWPISRIPVVAFLAVDRIRIHMTCRYKREERTAVFTPEISRIRTRIVILLGYPL